MNVHKRVTIALSTAALGAGLALGAPATAAPAPANAVTSTAVTVPTTGVPSSADAAASVRRDLCFTGACGSATVKFTSSTTAYVKMSLKDTKCDAKGPTLQMQGSQYSYNQQRQYISHGTKHKNTKGCRGDYQPWEGYYGHSDGDRLDGLRVRICQGSRCETSTWMVNPR
ncbi:hypothetical protein ABVG11_00180 [Streptomyces sp. HD1123-B1]|uniref:hypothetical protein n=1 Tax=Streptomyces huangiella TaxID=3228804 RepID=UPI003D7DFD22